VVSPAQDIAPSTTSTIRMTIPAMLEVSGDHDHAAND
jgi:hypothetical protein